jgi:hypothetical protein
MVSKSINRDPLRQGDILLVPTDGIPSGVEAVKKEHGAIVLAYGEQHGHRHQLARGAKLFARGTGRYLDVSARGGALLTVTNERGVALAELRHEPIRVPCGAWEVVRQVEWTASEEARTVQD